MKTQIRQDWGAMGNQEVLSLPLVADSSSADQYLVPLLQRHEVKFCFLALLASRSNYMTEFWPMACGKKWYMLLIDLATKYPVWFFMFSLFNTGAGWDEAGEISKPPDRGDVTWNERAWVLESTLGEICARELPNNNINIWLSLCEQEINLHCFKPQRFGTVSYRSLL